MGRFVLWVLIKLQRVREDAAQETVEYALIVALMAFGAVAGMQSLAGGVTAALNDVSTTLATSL